MVSRARTSKVIVRGYADIFSAGAPVSVVWDGVDKGLVKKGQTLSFEIEQDGLVLFKAGRRRTKVAVHVGRTNDIQLAHNGIFGLSATELVADVAQFQKRVAANKATPSSQGRAEPPSPQKLNCPHCGAQQTVTRASVNVNTRPSFSKVATGFLTMGNSLIFTGVHKKQPLNELSCSACEMVWHVA